MLNWLARRLRYTGRTRPGMAPGWREPLVEWKVPPAWDWHRQGRPRLEHALASLREGQRVIHLRNYAELEAFAAAFAAGSLDWRR
jgi:hypothetical protein